MHLVRCGAIAGFETLLYKQGVDPVAVLAEFNITSSQLRNPDTYISYLKIAHLLELASERAQDPYFGLRLASSQEDNVLGEVGHALSIQSTFAETMGYLKQHLHLHAQGAYIHEQPYGDFTRLEFSLGISAGEELPQLIQMSIGQMSKGWISLIAGDSRFSMHLKQTNEYDTVDRIGLFNFNSLVFGSDFDGIQFPTSWKQEIFNAGIDPKSLRNYIQQRVEQLEENHPQSLQDQLRLLLTRALVTGDYSVERMAAALDIHPRNLQKRLQSEGTSYSQVLQKTREDIACQNLKYGNISITDLALQLGYAEAAIFSRHFKRWTGLSPRAWRDEHRVLF